MGVSPAEAQARSQRWEFSGGVIWARGFALNAISGDETQPNGSPLPLFTAQTRLDPAAGFAATLSRQVAGPISAEADGSWSKPTYRTTVTSDAENAMLGDLTNAATEFAVAGAVVVTLALALAARNRSCGRAAAGGVSCRRTKRFRRTAASCMIGGGVKYWMGGRGSGGPLGLRVDAGVLGRSGGLAVTGGFRFAPAVGASLSLRF